jgi:selenocysteine-specific translation elongation factor
MLKYISIIFIVLSFTGCQQALDDLNKSLEDARMNLNSNNAYNSNQNEYIQKKNERNPVPRLNEEEVNARYEEMFKRWAEEDKQKSIKYEQEKKEREIKQAEEKSKIDSERKKVQNACQTWLKKSQKEV